jgi:hypothetical protein
MRVRPLRSENKVNMIGHETVGTGLDPRLARLLGQQIAIDLMVAVLKKDRLPPIPTLRYVMWKAGNYHAGESRHGAS